MATYAFQGVVPVVAETAFVHPQASIIGDVRIGAHCYIGPGASLRGDYSPVIVGAGCNIQDNVVVHGSPGVELVLEDEVHVGHGAVVHACRAGRNCLIGINAVVFDGAVIGEEAVVAAMSFVPAGFVVPARHLVAGVPAKLVRPLRDEDVARKSKGTLSYQLLAAACRESLRPCEPLRQAEAARREVDVSAFWPAEE